MIKRIFVNGVVWNFGFKDHYQGGSLWALITFVLLFSINSSQDLIWSISIVLGIGAHYLFEKFQNRSKHSDWWADNIGDYLGALVGGVITALTLIYSCKYGTYGVLVGLVGLKTFYLVMVGVIEYLRGKIKRVEH